MLNTRFEDPAGLTSNNVSTAIDLAKMVTVAYKYQLIREVTTAEEAKVKVDGQDQAYRNTRLEPHGHNDMIDLSLQGIRLKIVSAI